MVPAVRWFRAEIDAPTKMFPVTAELAPEFATAEEIPVCVRLFVVVGAYVIATVTPA
jgi:hypothetical protein